MGQQQLLLIVLALIIVAIAISVSLFRSNAIEGKRDILIQETSAISALAIQYFKKPQEFGGGGQSFLGWKIPNQMNQTPNGNFMTAQILADEVKTVVGTGSDVVTADELYTDY